MISLRIVVFLLFSVVSICSTKFDQVDEEVITSHHVSMFLDIMEKGLIYSLKNFTQTGYRSDFFTNFIETIPEDPEVILAKLEENPEKFILTCTACRVYVASLLADRRNNNASPEELADSAFGMCRIVTDFSDEVCRGVIDLNVEPMIFIVDSRPSLTATQMCGLALQGECGALDPMFSFTVSVSAGPPITQPKSVSTPRGPNDLVIIHVTDMHYDENYREGNNANCINPICCRVRDGIPSNPSDAGGFWGDYRHCGTPWRSVEDTLRRIRSAHPRIDLVYHTGDMRDHGVWETSVAASQRITGRIYDLYRNVFGNIPVIHALGNHEAQPVNQFAPSTVTRPTLSANWLYNFSADTWLRHGWINAAAASTIRFGGYYTMLIRPGFRVIVLNNNDCYKYNWWVMYSRSEIQGQLQWLHNTLLAAESSNERVHLLMHIPSGGSSCFRPWSIQFRRIVDRFHMIIGGQFTGHSHRDEFEVFYDSATAQHAINVAWNAGSTTAYNNINPNYNLYFVDPIHYQVNDKESYIFSISEANRTPSQSPRWFLHYNFRTAFGLNDFSPATLDRLAFDLSRNRNLNRNYWRFRNKAGDPIMQRGCDDNCLRSQVCRIVTNEFQEHRRCNQVLAVFGTVA